MGTELVQIGRTSERGMTAVIRAVEPGKPVPDISIRRLSALLDWPEEEITIKPVPGRGAGLRRLSVGQAEPDAEADLTAVWAEQIAAVAMPGAVLTDVRVGRAGVAIEAGTLEEDGAVPGTMEEEDT